MALNAYLKVKAQTQGDIKGSCTQKGRQDLITVLAVHHSMMSPRDAASGAPTGKRQHKPLVITKEVDKSTPLLYLALCRNENLTELKLDHWRPSMTGKEEQFYSIELRNANVCQIDYFKLDNRKPEQMKFAEYEQISFVPMV